MRARILVPVLLLSAVLGGSPAAGGGTPPVAALIGGAEVRPGVQHRSLVVLPLLLRDGNEGAGPPPAAGGAVEWAPVDGREDAKAVVVRWSGAPAEGAAPRSAVLPPGLLLEGGPRERLLSRPLLLAEGAPPRARARRSDLPPAKESAPAGPAGRLGPVAPTDQRRVDLLLGDEEPLETLLRIQAALAGMEEEGLSVRKLLDAPALEKAMGEAVKSLDPIPGSYGGSAIGHVVFLGNRASEIVLFPNPALYRAHGPAYMRGLALGLALWERYYGVEGVPVKPADQELLLIQARRILEDLAGAATGIAKAGSGEAGGGKLLVVSRKATGREKSWTPSLVGRCLLGEDGGGILLDVFEDLDSVVLPAPLTEPGGRPSDLPPSNKSGALTVKYLERLLQRKAEARGGRGGR